MKAKSLRLSHNNSEKVKQCKNTVMCKCFVYYLSRAHTCTATESYFAGNLHSVEWIWMPVICLNVQKRKNKKKISSSRYKNFLISLLSLPMVATASFSALILTPLFICKCVWELFFLSGLFLSAQIFSHCLYFATICEHFFVDGCWIFARVVDVHCVCFALSMLCFHFIRFHLTFTCSCRCSIIPSTPNWVRSFNKM